MARPAYTPTTELLDKICSKCGDKYYYINTGKCANCIRKEYNAGAKPDLISKRRRLLKERELRDIDRPYFEG